MARGVRVNKKTPSFHPGGFALTSAAIGSGHWNLGMTYINAFVLLSRAHNFG